MNNKAQTLGLGILVSIFVLIIGLMMINFLMPEITNARINLSCTDVDNISDGVKLTCLMISATIPYWIVLIFSLVIGGIISYSGIK